MEAKDTVMSGRDLDKVIANITVCEERLGIIVAKAQAEISFRAGVKEVVEWVEANVGLVSYLHKEWQAKLKEWGL